MLFYFIDQSSGLTLIDAGSGRMYMMQSEACFSRAKTLAISLLNKQDPTKGFRLIKLDQKISVRPEIVAYEFDAEYLTKLNELSAGIQ